MNRLTALSCLAALMALAGCGGGSTTTSTTTATTRASSAAQSQPSPATSTTTATSGQSSSAAAGSTQNSHTGVFAAATQAEAICERASAELAAEKQVRKRRHRGASEIVRVTPKQTAIEMRAVRELEALTPPPSESAAWREIIALRRKLADELVTLERDTDTGDLAGVRALTTAKGRVHAKLVKTAFAATLSGCASY
jgi:hypothetical protein